MEKRNQPRFPTRISERRYVWVLRHDLCFHVYFCTLFDKFARLFFHPLLQRLFLGDALFGGVFAVHAGFSTTLPSCQTITGRLTARCWVVTLLPARARARSASAAQCGRFA